MNLSLWNFVSGQVRRILDRGAQSRSGFHSSIVLQRIRLSQVVRAAVDLQVIEKMLLSVDLRTLTKSWPPFQVHLIFWYSSNCILTPQRKEIKWEKEQHNFESPKESIHDKIMNHIWRKFHILWLIGVSKVKKVSNIKEKSNQHDKEIHCCFGYKIQPISKFVSLAIFGNYDWQNKHC